jgi:benzoyl-CoA reductase/2-hydroxyglutaryl-CoA dehydratase subunit BcrC/BadD/HgdB
MSDLPPLLSHFDDMVDHCYDYAEAAKSAGKPVVGMMCEYTPREIILAAGAIPVCLCGGSAERIPAAEKTLPANLCPLIKSTFGYHVEKRNPFLEWADLVVAETTCDGKKKMFELMAQSRPMYVLHLPHRPDRSASLELWKSEMHRLMAELERRFATTVTEERLRSAVRLMNQERRLRRELAELMKADNPPLTGRQLLDLKSLISGIPEDLAQYQRILDAARSSPRQRNGHRVRVCLTGVPLPHGAERVMDIIESQGGLVVCQENCTGLKPILEDVDEQAPDLLDALARKYFATPCSVLSPNDGRLDSLRSLCRDFRADCVIELIWQACLTYDVEAHRVRELCETGLHLPYLGIQTDYSPSDSARIAVRVEALFESILAKREKMSAG